MLLVVDVGNTHTVLGLYEERDLVHDFRIESRTSRTLDELHVLLRSLLDVAEVERDEIEAAIIASVVPALTETLARAISLAFGFEALPRHSTRSGAFRGTSDYVNFIDRMAGLNMLA